MNTPTVYEVLSDKASIGEALQHAKNGDIIPANILLSGADLEAGRITHNNNPILSDATNTGIQTDRNGNIAHIKAQSTKQSIDVPPLIVGLCKASK